MKTLTIYISEQLSSKFKFAYGGRVNEKDVPLTTLHFKYPEAASLYKISIADDISMDDEENSEETNTSWQLNTKMVIDGDAYYNGHEHETETFNIDSTRAINAMKSTNESGRYYQSNQLDLFSICIGSILSKNELCSLHYQQLVEIAWGFGFGVYNRKSDNIKYDNFDDVKDLIKSGKSTIPAEIEKAVLHNKLFTSENYEKFKTAWTNLTEDDVKTYFNSLIKTLTNHK